MKAGGALFVETGASPACIVGEPFVRKEMKMEKTIRFEKDVHAALWGHEEWLVSAHSSAPGRVVSGDGKTLRDICPAFPLLIKKICANQRLSVQVHVVFFKELFKYLFKSESVFADRKDALFNFLGGVYVDVRKLCDIFAYRCMCRNKAFCIYGF